MSAPARRNFSPASTSEARVTTVSLRLRAFCGENNEEVFGIGGQCSNQSFRSENAGFA